MFSIEPLPHEHLFTAVERSFWEADLDFERILGLREELGDWELVGRVVFEELRGVFFEEGGVPGWIFSYILRHVCRVWLFGEVCAVFGEPAGGRFRSWLVVLPEGVVGVDFEGFWFFEVDGVRVREGFDASFSL